MKKGYIILIIIFLLFIAGCSSNNQPSEVGNNIQIANFAFSPSELIIKKGETVTWVNQDSVKHTITSDSGTEISSQLLSKSETYSHTFNTQGTFSYHCSLHSGMAGKIIVQ